MTPDDAARTLRMLSAAWPFFPASEDTAQMWVAALLPLDAEAARNATRKCAESMDHCPSLASFLRVVCTEARIVGLSSRALSAPGGGQAACFLCDGTGWQQVATVAGNAVARCRCSAGKVNDNHPTNCACMTCHYGGDQAGRIRAGVDGFKRSGADPLAMAGVGSAGAPPESFEGEW